MYELFWRIKKGLDRYFYDERYAGRVRFFFFFSLTGVVVLLGYNLFEHVDTTGIEENWRNRFTYNFLLQWIGVLGIRVANFFLYSFRHMIIPVSVFIGILFASAFYVQDVYELPTLSLALRYIVASFIGLNFPYLTIEDGKRQIKKGEVNLIDTIGGPGYVNIRPGNVVLFESLRSPSSVRSTALHFISRFETIKEIVSLDDQHGFIEQMRVKTRDGIPIVVRDAHYRYRLRTGRRFGDHERRRAINPYRYSVQAMKAMAYNRAVRSKGLSDWHTTVRLAVEGAITDYIRSHKFDQLTAPSYGDADPRAEINKNMMGAGTRGRLRNVGAELLWFDIGHFDVVEKIDDALEMKRTIEDQRIDTWSARWDGEVMVVHAYGKAQRMAYQEVGRAEGQADILLSIIQALEEVDSESTIAREEQRLKNLRGILWTRVAQVLDRIAEEDEKQESSNKLLPPDSAKQ
jgi:hypothetical protein